MATSEADKQAVRLAAIGDMHITRQSQGVLQPILSPLNEQAEALLLCGDLTDYGTAEEAQVLVRELSVLRIPVVAVLGNHDHESGEAAQVSRILSDAGVRVLDGEACEIHGIGFAGVKGFSGGFGPATLGAWGEAATKQFVQEAINEAMKLESALARLRTRRRVALLHYAPIRGTVEGEPEQIFSFLGTSRLEEPLNRYPIDAIFHGHAHRGTLQGQTSKGVPVYNVAMPLLRRAFPDQPPVRIIELPAELEEPPATNNAAASAGTRQPVSVQGLSTPRPS